MIERATVQRRVVVRAEAACFAFGPTPVLDDLALEVMAGEVFGIVGPDGAGKSTLLRLLLGQLTPTSGDLCVLGLPATAPALRRRVAYMPQAFGQYPDLSVQENLEFFADLHGLTRDASRALIDDLLQRTALRDFRTRRAGQLSGGMLQKLALACALVSRPEVMLLDEPTTGVDPISRRALWQLLDQVRADGVAIVLATANMDEAERCDRVGLLIGGRLQRQGTPSELVRQSPLPLFELAGSGIRALRQRVRDWPCVALVFPVGQTLRVWLTAAGDEAAFRDELTRLEPVPGLRRIEPSLHDVALRDLAFGLTAHDERATGDGH